MTDRVIPIRRETLIMTCPACDEDFETAAARGDRIACPLCGYMARVPTEDEESDE